MSSRDAILSAVRKSLDARGRPEGGAREAAGRLEQHPRGVTPGLAADAVVARFIEQARAASASVVRVRRAGIAGAVAEWLRERNLPKAARMGADPRMAAVDWASAGLETAFGRSDGHDLNGISHAFAGVAETGTLVLASGPDNPTTLNFLPENHVVLVDTADLVANYEAAFERLRSARGETGLPRTVNMITGPSRSADIEQTLILGAHGPVRLHILIVDD